MNCQITNGYEFKRQFKIEIKHTMSKWKIWNIKDQNETNIKLFGTKVYFSRKSYIYLKM